MFYCCANKFCLVAGLLFSVLAIAGWPTAHGQSPLALLSDTVLDSDALLMPRGATYGPAINGVSYNNEALLTVGNYQYATWYHYDQGGDQNIFLARRDTSGASWEVVDTGQDFVNGQGSWNAHNIVSMGIDGEGRIHLSYDHHNNYMNYRDTNAGAATAAVWNPTLNPEANTLNTNVPNPPPVPFNDVTYPRFISDPTSGNLLMTFRNGVSGDGNVYLTTYDVATDTWATPQEIINGQIGTYTDAVGSSDNRNAYLNGLDIDNSGRIHTTWTWRESAGGTNHDIMYAYSDDGGSTWKNNNGVAVASPGNPLHLDSPGVNILDMDRRNTLMNQQAQIVDPDGGVHAVMWHATDANANSVSGFTTTPSAYFHYYRDPGQTLFADYFDGSGSMLSGTTPDVTLGGEAWEAGDTFLDDGIAATTVSGIVTGQAAHLDFTPQPGRIYTAEATLLNNQSNWVGFGFLPDDPAAGDWTQTDFSVRHSNAPGYAWLLTRNSNGTDQEGFLGGGATGGQPWNGDVVDPTLPVDMKIVLDTTGDNWTVEWFLNGDSQGLPVAYADPGNPGIAGIGFSHDRSDSANGGATITNFSLKEGEGIGEWSRNDLPTERAVGSRPDLASDADGNLYAVYVSPGAGDGGGVAANYYTNGDLIVAMASKATGWQDWEIVYTDDRDFVGEPQLDHSRLRDDGIVSVFVQENGDNIGVATGSDLHVLEFNKLPHHLVWAGDQGTTWDLNTTSNWDSRGDDRGDSTFADGYRVTFDDGASNFAVNLASPVAPSSTQFLNTVGNDYALTGEGIGGAGGLSIRGGGGVTLANAANTYTGDTNIEAGTLALVGSATISSSPVVSVEPAATLDVSGLALPFALASGQTLNNRSATVVGDVVAKGGSTITGNGTFTSSVTAQAGAVVQIGGVGLITTQGPDVFTLVDDFNTEDGAAGFAFSKILDFGNGATNTFFNESGGTLNVTQVGFTGTAEQALLLHPTPLAPGEELQVDLSGAVDLGGRDFGIAVGETHGDLGNTDGDNRGTADYVFLSLQSLDVNGFGWSSRGFLEGDEIALNGSFANVSLDKLFMKRLETGQLEMGYYSGTSRTVLRTINPATSDMFDNVGFYTDLRDSGSGWAGADDLGIVSPGPDTQVGEVFTVEGAMALESGATLLLDIGASGASDLLSVGTLTAGGTLQVALDDQAPSPLLGDQFTLFEFDSAAGAFDNFLLPAIAMGLGWNTTDLLATGVLSVGLAGDYNGDGTVNLADYSVWRGHLGGGWISNRHSQLVGSVGFDDYLVWKANFAASLSPSTSGLAAVPEPNPLVALLLAVNLAAATRCNCKRNRCRS